jgi:hypothetical protein
MRGITCVPLTLRVIQHGDQAPGTTIQARQAEQYKTEYYFVLLERVYKALLSVD